MKGRCVKKPVVLHNLGDGDPNDSGFEHPDPASERLAGTESS